MANPRIHHADFIHLVTNRTEHGMYFLTPTKHVNHLVRFWLARAKRLHGPHIEIFAFCFLSNHFHMLLRDPRGELAAFMGYFQGHLARAVNRAIGRKGGTFWASEYDDKIIDGEKAFIGILAYVLCNPVKSGLVDTPGQWKGVSSLLNNLDGTPFSERGLKVSEYNEARRHGRKANRRDFEKEYSFELSPLPIWEGLSHAARRERLTELLTSAGGDYRKKRQHRRALGMKKILHQSVYDASKNFTPRPRKRFHCSCEARLKELEEMFRAFVGRYRECLEVFYRRIYSCAKTALAPVIKWPPGSYPPSCARPVIG
jgi:REP element-mobilizing transposase RayT